MKTIKTHVMRNAILVALPLLVRMRAGRICNMVKDTGRQKREWMSSPTSGKKYSPAEVVLNYIKTGQWCDMDWKNKKMRLLEVSPEIIAVFKGVFNPALTQ